MPSRRPNVIRDGVITSAMQQQHAELPPPGDARRETLAERQDQLDEAAETAGPEKVAFDPAKVALENEVVAQFNSFEVSDAQPGYRYKWVFTGQHGNMVNAYLAIRLRIAGRLEPTWEVVKADMPEAMECKAVDGTRRIADVLLMRCRTDKAKLIDAEHDRRRRARETGVSADMIAMADKYRDKGVILHTDARWADPRFRDEMRRAAASGIAKSQFNDMIKEGTVPGLAPGRAAGRR